jgi:TonB family protein
MFDHPRLAWEPDMRRIALFAVVVVMAASTIAVAGGSGERRTLLASYCADARKNTDTDVIDPTKLANETKFVQPIPTEILGQRIKAASRRMGLEGTVTVGLIVGAEGKGRQVRVVKSSGQMRVDEEAVSILNGAVFAPARVNDSVAVACTVIRVVFTMK